MEKALVKTDQENNTLVKVDPQQYGLDESRAKQVESAFQPMIKKMAELEAEYNELVNKDITPDLCVLAKELRLKYVKVRTGTAKIHKEAKAFYLAGGKFIDAWKNTQTFISQGIEEKLESLENHYIRIEQEKREKLQAERMEAYKPFIYPPQPEGFPEPDLASMPDDVWNNFITGAKKAHKDRLAAEKKAEKERLAKEKAEAEAKAAQEKAEAEERERIRKENERLKAEAEERERQRKKEEEEKRKAEEQEKTRLAKLQSERYKAYCLYFSDLSNPPEELPFSLMTQDKWESVLAEAKNNQVARKQERERKAKEAKEQAERDKREAEERRRLKEEAEKAKAEKERLEKAAEEKRLADERVKKERAKEERRKKNAPDKEKLLLLAHNIKNFELPEVKETEAKEVISRTKTYLDRLYNNIMVCLKDM